MHFLKTETLLQRYMRKLNKLGPYNQENAKKKRCLMTFFNLWLSMNSAFLQKMLSSVFFFFFFFKDSVLDLENIENKLMVTKGEKNVQWRYKSRAWD